MTHQSWNIDYDTTDDLLNRKNVKKIMRANTKDLEFTF